MTNKFAIKIKSEKGIESSSLLVDYPPDGNLLGDSFLYDSIAHTIIFNSREIAERECKKINETREAKVIEFREAEVVELSFEDMMLIRQKAQDSLKKNIDFHKKKIASFEKLLNNFKAFHEEEKQRLINGKEINEWPNNINSGQVYHEKLENIKKIFVLF